MFLSKEMLISFRKDFLVRNSLLWDATIKISKARTTLPTHLWISYCISIYIFVKWYILIFFLIHWCMYPSPFFFLCQNDVYFASFFFFFHRYIASFHSLFSTNAIPHLFLLPPEAWCPFSVLKKYISLYNLKYISSFFRIHNSKIFGVYNPKYGIWIIYFKCVP